jgi:LytS/YehU family sensor histidine kinase
MTVLHLGITVVALSVVSPGNALTVVKWIGNWILWDLTAYAALVVAIRSAALAARAQRERVRIARLNAQAAVVRTQVRQLQLQPDVMLSSLDHVGACLDSNSQTCDAAIVSLGDLLRAIRDGGSRDDWCIGDELRTIEKYLSVRNAAHRTLAVSTRVERDAIRALVPSGLLTPLIVSLSSPSRAQDTTTSDCRITINAVANVLLVGMIAHVPSSGAADVAATAAPTEERVRTLLEILYPGEVHVSVTVVSAGTLCVQLRLPYIQSAPAASRAAVALEAAAS